MDQMRQFVQHDRVDALRVRLEQERVEADRSARGRAASPARFHLPHTDPGRLRAEPLDEREETFGRRRKIRKRLAFEPRVVLRRPYARIVGRRENLDLAAAADDALFCAFYNMERYVPPEDAARRAVKRFPRGRRVLPDFCKMPREPVPLMQNERFRRTLRHTDE